MDSTTGETGLLLDVEQELDEPELKRWAVEVGLGAAETGILVALYGPLGSGKSTLVRAACRAAGIEGPIPSPTFTLVNRYRLPDGRFIHHVDLYRIDTELEVLELGWDDIVSDTGPVFVEWAERATSLLPADRWDIRLDFGRAPELRSVRATRTGEAPRYPA